MKLFESSDEILLIYHINDELLSKNKDNEYYCCNRNLFKYDEGVGNKIVNTCKKVKKLVRKK